MNNTYLVRLKPYDPRRGHVLRRYTYRGIKFVADHGWYRVDKRVADYLCTIRQIATDEHSPLAFDVCTEADAMQIDAKEHEAANPRKAAGDDIRLSTPRDEARPVARDGTAPNSASEVSDDVASSPTPQRSTSSAAPQHASPSATSERPTSSTAIHASSAKPERDASSARPEAVSRPASNAPGAPTAAPTPRSTAPPAERSKRARRAGGR